LEIELVEEANRIATHSLEPNLIVLLDLAPEEGLARKRCAMPDRMEQEDIAFHRRVREGYLKMAKADLQRWLVIDGTLPEAQIRRQIWQRVEQFLV
jgi:dTMP kinase